jgi:hypothetical protein
MLKKIGLLSLATASAFAMHTFEININDKDLGLSLKLDMGQFGNVEPGTTFVGFKMLNGSESHSNIDDRITSLYEMNFLKTKHIASSNLALGLGVKANYTALDDDSFISIPLGFEGIYDIPSSSIVPITLNASIYYAPEVLALNEADEFVEFGVNARFEIIENGLIVVGYRNIHTNYKVNKKSTDFRYNDSGYVGFKFAF